MQQDIDISIGDLLRFIGRGLLPAVLVAAVVGFLAYRLTNAQPRVYEAQATVLAAETNPDYSRFGVSPVVAPPVDVSAYVVVAKSDPVLTDALSRTGVPDPGPGAVRSLRGHTSLRTSDTRTSSLITVAVENGDPQTAADRANALAAALVDWDKQRATEGIEQIITALQRQIDQLAEQIRSLQALGDASRQTEITGLINLRAQQQQAQSQAQALRVSAIGRLTVLQQAAVPAVPIAPRPMFTAVLAIAIAVLLTYALLLLRAVLDTRLRSAQDITAVTGLPILAEFPRLPRGTRRLPREAASYLRTSVLFSTADAEPKVILVTSPRSGDGKSSVALSLAEGFARNDYRTLLVDADLRQPVIHTEYRISRVQNGSLIDFLNDPTGPHQIARVLVSAKQQLHVVPAFQASPQAAELLGRSFRTCLARWSKDYDVIIIDSPPVLAVADALTIAPLATGTLLVTNIQRTDRRQVRAAVDLLNRVGVQVLGVAATMVADAGTSRGPGTTGYGYGPELDDDGPPLVVRSGSAGNRARVTPRSPRG